MKYTNYFTKYLLILFSSLFGHFLFAEQRLAPTKTNDSLQTSLLASTNSKSKKGFVQNKGQFSDPEGNLVPNVLFKYESNGIILWVTDKGITFQTLKHSLLKEKNNSTAEVNEQNKFHLTQDLPKYKTEWERVDLILKNASISKDNLLFEDANDSYENYFLAHCPEGIYNVSSYNKVTIKNVYKGIDWVFQKKKDGTIKYDFIVQPGIDFNKIQLQYKSKSSIKIKKDGSLSFQTSIGDFSEQKPVSFCEEKVIETKFNITSQKPLNLNGDNGFETNVVFEIGESYDHSKTLIIDPILEWGTFFGPENEQDLFWLEAGDSQTDQLGNFFVTGTINGQNVIPTFSIGSGVYFQGVNNGGFDLFILKFDPGYNLVWSTYYGGTEGEIATSLDVNLNNEITIVGSRFIFTGLNDFPLQDQGGGAYFENTPSSTFIIKFNNAGVRLWSTYFGETMTSFDRLYLVKSDSFGNTVVVGTASPTSNFPLQNSPGAYYKSIHYSVSSDLIITKFSPLGNIQWSTYFGGDMGMPTAIDIDLNNNVYIGGYIHGAFTPVFAEGGSGFVQNFTPTIDGFLLKFSNIGELLWSTSLGGENADYIEALQIDSNDKLLVTGQTTSQTFPVVDPGNGVYFQGVQNGDGPLAYLIKFDPSNIIEYSTFIGTQNGNSGASIAIDSCNNYYVSFSSRTNSSLPFKEGCINDFFQSNLSYPTNGNTQSNLYQDNFLTYFCSNNQLKWSSYLSGEFWNQDIDLSIDINNDLYLLQNEIRYNSNDEIFYGFGDGGEYPLLNAGGFFDGIHSANRELYIAKFSKSTIDSSSTPETCSSLGSIDVSACGLCAPYDFVWSNGTSIINTLNPESSITGLVAGNYHLILRAECDTLELDFVIPYNCNVDNSFCSQFTPIINSSGWIELLEGTPNVPNQDLPCNEVEFASSDVTPDFVGYQSPCINPSDYANDQYWLGNDLDDERIVFTFDNPVNSVRVYFTYQNPNENLEIGYNGNRYPLTFSNVQDAVNYSALACGTQLTPNVQTFIIDDAFTGNNSSTTEPIGFVMNGMIEVDFPNPANSFYLRNYVRAPWSNSAGSAYRIFVEYDIPELAEVPESIILGCNESDTIFSCYSCQEPRWANANFPNVIIHTGPYLVVSPTTSTDYLVYFENDTLTTSVIIEGSTTTTIIDTTICEGTNYDLNGTIVSLPGYYYDTLTSINGCDSIIELHLNNTFTVTSTEYHTVVADDPFTFPDGTEIIVTGSAVHESHFTSSTGCDSIVYSILTVNPIDPLSVEIICLSNNLCTNELIQYYPHIIDGDVLTYSWSFPDGVPSSSNLGTPPEIVYTQGGYKMVLLTVTDGVSTFDTTFITYIYPSYLISDVHVVCPNSSFTFPDGTQINNIIEEVDHLSNYTTINGCDSIINTTITVAPYNITENQLAICSGETFQIGNEFYTPINDTIISNVVPSQFGCDSLVNTTVQVNPRPTVSISENVTILNGASTIIEADTDSENWLWSPVETLSCIDCLNPIASPSQTTTYTIQSDLNGCITEQSVIVTVEVNHTVYIPNIFSPNGDLDNDILFVRAKDVESLDFIVFDRWGEVVFESNSTLDGWDGNFRGQKMNAGVYVYVANVTFIDGFETQLKGDITLIR